MSNVFLVVAAVFVVFIVARNVAKVGIGLANNICDVFCDEA